MSKEMTLAGRVIRNENDEILVKRGEYWGIDVLDIRWFSNDKPTKKGVRLNIDEAKELLKILREELDDGN
jgi:hypothetical protein